MRYWICAIAAAAVFLVIAAANERSDERLALQELEAARAKGRDSKWSELDKAGRQMSGYDQIAKPK